MKIAFVGDSFCAESGTPWRGYSAWTMLLLKEFNATASQIGLGGDCLFHSYQKLLRYINTVDYIIFCITEPNRLANRFNIPMNIGIAENEYIPDPMPPINIQEASQIYYRELINFDFHKMAHKGILMQIDQLILKKKKKCIWFPCFDTSLQEYKITSGPCGTTPLMTIAERNGSIIPHSNHFSEEQNKNMFTLLKNIINNDTFGPVNLNTEIL
jgi:hypothetical protein